ncbi:MAG TPA: tetratricopeptide repeat protein [Proteobacteria bacterium]|nr:tetratricopeptide repeat protein [Pseudomonadota bacterium]
MKAISATLKIGLIGLGLSLLFVRCGPKPIVEQKPAPQEETQRLPAEAQLDPKQIARAKFREGVEEVGRGNLAAARSAFEDALKSDPSLGEAHLELAKVLMRSGEFSLAADHFKSAAKLLPSREQEIRPLLYESLRKTGRLADLLAQVNGELARDPKNPYALYRKAVVLLELGQVAEAKRIARELIKSKNDFALAYAVLARCFWKEGNLTLAKITMETASKWDAKNSVILTDLGTLEYLLGYPEEARKLFVRAVNADKNNAYAHNNLGVLLLNEGREKDAASEFSEAIRLDATLAEAYLNRAEARRRMGEVDAALQDVLVAQKLNPRMPEVYLLLGILQETKGLNDLAKTNYQRYWSMAPSSARDERVLRWIQALEKSSGAKGGKQR